MDTQRRDILRLISAAIKREKAELSSDFSLDSVMPTIKKHNIITLCYYGAIECGMDQESAEMCEMFDYVCHYLLISERQNYALKEIFDTFDQNGISYMPLKGILLKNMYPCPEMRAMGDLDILIKLEEYPKIKTLLQALNYTEHLESDHELIWSVDMVQIELHKRLIPSYNKDYYSYFGDGWKLAKINNGTQYSMTDEDQLIYLFTHFAKHYRDGGIGIRQMVDLWIYHLCKPNMDVEYIKNELSVLSLYEFYKNICDTLSVWFGDGRSDEITDLITDTVFNSGVFGNRESHVLSNGVKASTTTGVKNVRKAKFLRLLFLPYDAMCNKYKFLKKWPILLPIMWVVRWVEVLFCKRKNIDDTISDLKLLDRQKIKEHKKSLERVGLAFNFKE